jgi:MoxR-like ATPase
MPFLPQDLKNVTNKPSGPFTLNRPEKSLSEHEWYEPDPGLVDAIEVALLLRMPLLLTGRPGTGKTDLGHYLGWKMNKASYQFNAKSASVWRDLYYSYDAIRHYREGGDAGAFLTFDALGEAMLRCAVVDEDLVKHLPEWAKQPRTQSVVVIDEIDKAPRDFPNDLLNEIYRNYFYVQELKNLKVQAAEDLAPVVVITSNSEKNLPPAFLRRCVYFDIPFPKEDALRRIVSKRVKAFTDENGVLLKTAVARFSDLASEESRVVNRKPGTAELLDFMSALIRLEADPNIEIDHQKEKVKKAVGTLAKSPEDQEKVRAHFGVG